MWKETQKSGPAILPWSPLIKSCLWKFELRRFYSWSGQSHDKKLSNLLERSKIDAVIIKTREILHDVGETCHVSQMYPQNARQFKFTLRDDKDFNHAVYVDTFCVLATPVLHAVEEAASYEAAQFLTMVSSQCHSRARRLCSINVYFRQTNIIVHSACKTFLAESFVWNADVLHLWVKAVPVGSANSITKIELYRPPMTRAYPIVKNETPGTYKWRDLQMTVKKSHISIIPDIVVPTILLLWCTAPSWAFSWKADSVHIPVAVSCRKVAHGIMKIFTERQLQSKISTQNEPDDFGTSTMAIDSEALDYRIKKNTRYALDWRLTSNTWYNPLYPGFRRQGPQTTSTITIRFYKV